jgi:hypothetical protein
MKKPTLLAEDVTIGRLTLLIAMDESGHEEFKGIDYFGFGGVAGFGPTLCRADRSWIRLRNRRFGVDHPMHASGPKMSPEQVDAISDFFRTSRIPRFAFLLTAPPIDLGRDGLGLLGPMLFQELLDFIERLPQLPEEIVLAFENSERLLPKLMAAVPSIEIETHDGRQIPVKLLVTPKSAGSPVMQMADHVIWRAQRARRHLSNAPIEPWFSDVFPRPPAAWSRYLELSVGSIRAGDKKLEFLPGGRVRVSFNATEPNKPT